MIGLLMVVGPLPSPRTRESHRQSRRKSMLATSASKISSCSRNKTLSSTIPSPASEGLSCIRKRLTCLNCLSMIVQAVGVHVVRLGTKNLKLLNHHPPKSSDVQDYPSSVIRMSSWKTFFLENSKRPMMRKEWNG